MGKSLGLYELTHKCRTRTTVKTKV